MVIKVLGTGCPKCKLLETHAVEAIEKAGVKAEIVKVTEVKDIMSYGVMNTPALVIDEKVISSGRVISAKEIIRILGEL